MYQGDNRTYDCLDMALLDDAALVVLANECDYAPARDEMERLNKRYEVHVFDGAGHGFLRQQQGREGANMRATEQAWARTLEFLRDVLND